MVICMVATYHIYGCKCDISVMFYLCDIVSSEEEFHGI